MKVFNKSTAVKVHR